MNKKSPGFSLIELTGAIAIGLIITVMAIPNVNTMVQSYRAKNDARGIEAQLSLARMRAASDSKPVQLKLNVAANTYQIEVCTNSTASQCYTSNATYTPEGGTQYLSQGITFGTGGVTTPAGGQTTVSQTTQITFNSRGISVDATGNPIGTAAIYLTNSAGAVYAVTVDIGGLTTAMQYTKSTTQPWSSL